MIPWTTIRFVVACSLATMVTAHAGENDLTGVWNGTYDYAPNDQRRPVDFSVVLIQKGDRFTGYIREPKTFGDGTSPWLHATASGRIDANNQVRFTKVYDGTANVDHEVVYEGILSDGRMKALNGKWQIPNEASGQFTLTKDPKTGPAPIPGKWSGTYYYAPDAKREPVRFSLLMVTSGDALVGFIREPNTFGPGPDVWLHATLAGRLNKANQQLIFTKTYDGTGKVNHSVLYRGIISDAGIDGSWQMQQEWHGKFTLRPDAADP